MEDFFFINTCKSNNFFPFAWSKLLCAQLSVQIRRFKHFEQTPDHKQFSDRVFSWVFYSWNLYWSVTENRCTVVALKFEYQGAEGSSLLVSY